MVDPSLHLVPSSSGRRWTLSSTDYVFLQILRIILPREHMQSKTKVTPGLQQFAVGCSVLRIAACICFRRGKCLKVHQQFTWTILTLRPVSLAKASLTFRQGFGLISKEALKARLCCVVRIVRGRFGPRRPSCVLAAGTRSSHEYSPITVKGSQQCHN